MTWATQYIEHLQCGETVAFRPRGNSMSPRIESGQLVTVVPAKSVVIEVGDVVLCRVGGKEYLHFVSGKRRSRAGVVEYQIARYDGRVNGWTPCVFGKCVRVEP